jgi:hypothetical protein
MRSNGRASKRRDAEKIHHENLVAELQRPTGRASFALGVVIRLFKDQSQGKPSRQNVS